MGYFFSFQQQLPEKHQLAAASTYPVKVISCKSFGEVFIWKKSWRFELVLAVWCSRFSYTLFNSLENKIKGKDEVVKLTFKFWIRNFMPALMYCTDINSSQYDLYKMTLYPAHTSDRAFFQRQGRPQKSQQEAKILCQPPPSYPSSPTSIPTYSYVGLEYVLLQVPAVAPSHYICRAYSKRSNKP